jgi:hypothetical protein
MGKPMTIRQRIVAALRGEAVDQVPFTIYPGMIPPGDAERRLRALGLGASSRVGLVKSSSPNVSVNSVEYQEQGARYSRTTVRTPVGEVCATHRLQAAYGSTWYVDHYVKSPDDYRVVEFMIRDTIYEPGYDSYRRAVESVGEDGYVSGNFGYSPLMEMRVNLLGIERFAYDQYDRPDLFFSLYETLRDKQREAYPILANSPAELVIYCGNCSPAVLGRRFEECCVPCYDELGEQLHANGKLLGCHLDANNAFWASAVAKSELDVIEAFTPAPDTDMSVADARAAWPGKVLWINYPSSLHLASPECIRAATLDLVKQAGADSRLIVGITENIPEHAWPVSLAAVGQALADAAKMRLVS